MKNPQNHKDYELGWMLFWAIHRPIRKQTTDRFFWGLLQTRRQLSRREKTLNIEAYVIGWIDAMKQANDTKS